MMKNDKKGITLVALVVTIIVLLILAAVSINLVLGENGIITRSREAKVDTEIDSEKQNIELVADDLVIEKRTDESIKHLTLDMVKRAVDKQIGLDKVTVFEKAGPLFEITYNDSNRTYTIDDEFEIESPKAGIKDKKYYVSSEHEFAITDLINEADIKTVVKNVDSYRVTGISIQPEGTVAQSQTGESGEFTLETEQGIAKYKLNHFLNDDEVYYVHTVINDEIEKVQKVTFKPASMMTYEIEFQGDDPKKNIVFKNTTDTTKTFEDDYIQNEDTTTIPVKTLKDENGKVLGHEQLANEQLGWSQGIGYEKQNLECISSFEFDFIGTGFDYNYKSSYYTGAALTRLYNSEGKTLYSTLVYTTTDYESAPVYIHFYGNTTNGVRVYKDKIQNREFGEYTVKISIGKTSKFYLDHIRIFR